MSWKKLGSGWLTKNKKSNPQNNLPMFTGDLKLTEDVLAGDSINVALWRKIDKFSNESFSVSASMNLEKEEEKEAVKDNGQPEIF